jgi:hypothetical protein
VSQERHQAVMVTEAPALAVSISFSIPSAVGCSRARRSMLDARFGATVRFHCVALLRRHLFTQGALNVVHATLAPASRLHFARKLTQAR